MFERPQGDPRITQLGSYSALRLPLRKVRVIRAGWYGTDKQPVTTDQVFELPADEAAGAVALGRAKFVK